MANVTVGAVSASVMRDGGVQHEYEDVGGDRVRMEDNSLRVSVKDTKNVWHLVTTLLSAADATSLATAVAAAPPITCSGDALGASFSCAGILHSKDRVAVLGTVKYRLRFSLVEI